MQKATNYVDYLRYASEQTPQIVAAMESKIVFKGSLSAGTAGPACTQYRPCAESTYILPVLQLSTDTAYGYTTVCSGTIVPVACCSPVQGKQSSSIILFKFPVLRFCWRVMQTTGSKAVASQVYKSVIMFLRHVAMFRPGAKLLFSVHHGHSNTWQMLIIMGGYVLNATSFLVAMQHLFGWKMWRK